MYTQYLESNYFTLACLLLAVILMLYPVEIRLKQRFEIFKDTWVYVVTVLCVVFTAMLFTPWFQEWLLRG